MDIRDWYVGQLVTEAEMDAAFADVESAINEVWSDTGMAGIASGFTVSEATPADLTVDVSGGLARSEYGERIYMVPASTLNVDCEFDREDNPTQVNTVGNSRILSVVAFFDRTLSDPRTDALNATVYFRRNEFLSVEIVQGDEAVTPTPPTVPAGGVRLANITLTHGQTTIEALDLDDTVRQDMFMTGAGPLIVAEGTLPDAFDAVVGALNQHLSGSAYSHSAEDITYGTSGFWADGTTKIVATDVEAAIDEIVSDLASITTNDSGAQRLGCEEDANAPTTLAAGPLDTRLASMRQAANLSYSGSGAWADASTLAASSVEAAIDSIVSSLASTSGSGGAIKVGVGARSAWLGGRTNAATHLYAAIDKIITDLGAVASGDDGAERIGAQARGNFAEGSVASQLAELVLTTDGDDGAKHIGAEAVGNLSVGTVRSQLDELDTAVGALDTAKANLSGATFTGAIVAQGNLEIEASSMTVKSGAGFGIAEGATATCADSFTLQGTATSPARLVYGNRSRLNCLPTRVTNADHTYNASDDGPVFVLAKPTAVRTLTIEQATDSVKENGDTLTFYMPDPPTIGNYYAIKREGSANNIVELNGTIAGSQEPSFCTIHLEGGVWRLTGGTGLTLGTDA